VSQAICHWLVPGAGEQMRDSFEIVAAMFAVIGHNYTFLLRFKGGKGIATSAGVLLALVPLSLVIIVSLWLVIFLLTGYVSLASICAAFTLPFATWLTGRSSTMILITGILAVLAIYKHRSNIQRLLKGTENRVVWRKKPAESEK
jgi:glycerol-3-phosphate acyltransferase PlsY